MGIGGFWEANITTEVISKPYLKKHKYIFNVCRSKMIIHGIYMADIFVW